MALAARQSVLSKVSGAASCKIHYERARELHPQRHDTPLELEARYQGPTRGEYSR
jgi:hypothetical protein